MAALIEPALGVLAGGHRRKGIVLAGGTAFVAALLVMSQASTFAWMLLGTAVLWPASGAFVSLSQATLMDLDPAGREAGMARWTLAGSLGVVLGPGLLSLALATRIGWRGAYVMLAAVTLPVLIGMRFLHFGDEPGSMRDGIKSALHALRSLEVLRWIMAVEAADTLGDIFTGFVALYLVDAAHVPPVQAGLGLVVLTSAGLAGDALLIPLLKRVSGIRFLRAGAGTALLLYPAFLLLPGLASKLIMLALIGLARAGWYAIPQARLYEQIPDSSETMLILSNAGSLIAAAIPLTLGVLAQGIGFAGAMWFLLLGPVALLILTTGAADLRDPV